MKKILLTLITGLGISMVAGGETFNVDGIEYSQLSGTTVEVVAKTPVYTGDIIIPEKVKNGAMTYKVKGIAKNAFQKSGITSIQIPSSVTSLGESAFELSRQLTEITIPGSIKVIPDNCFYSCSGLTKAVLEEGVTRIGSWGFCQTGKLVEISLPSTLTTIEDLAFVSDNSLREVNLPAACVNIAEGTFSMCEALENVNVEPANVKYCSVNGIVYSKDMTKLVVVPGAREELALPAGITTTAYRAAAGCQFKSLFLPEGVISLGEQAFFKCPRLRSVDLPSTITNVGENTFQECKLLTSVICRATQVPKANKYAFPNYETSRLMVPAGSEAAYQADEECFGKFVNIEAIPEGCQGKVTYAGTDRILKRSGATINFDLENQTPNRISTFDYELEVDGKKSSGQVKDVNIGAYTVYRLKLPIDEWTEGEHAGNLMVNTINGNENESENKTATFKVNVVKVNDIPQGTPIATYCDFKHTNGIGRGNGMTHYEAAVKFSDPNLVGAKVIGARYENLPLECMTNLQLWYSSKLDNSTSADGDIIDVEANNGVVETPFITPVTLDSKGKYFGISLDIEDGGTYYPLKYSTPANMKQGFMDNPDHKGWEDESEFGTLPILLYIESDFKPGSLKILDVSGSSAGAAGDTIAVTYIVQNYGGTEINDFDYSYTINGVEKTGHVTLDKPLTAVMSQKQEITIPYEPMMEGGMYAFDLTFTKVNGLDYPLDSKFHTSISVAGFKTTHRPIFEEFTGVACINCPRGTVGLHEMEKRYPDFISAAYHRYNSSDPMYLAEDQPFNQNGAPSGQFDRNGQIIDPYYGSSNSGSLAIMYDYQKALEIVSPADISVESSWDDAEQILTIKPTCKFSYVEENQEYKVGIILTIDSLDYEGNPEWKQANNCETMAQSTQPDELLKQIYLGGDFNPYHYDHVVIDQSLAKGFFTLKNREIELGKTYDCYTQLNLSQSSLANGEWLADEDMNNVNVIAILLDKKGTIRNAFKAKAGNVTQVNILETGMKQGMTSNEQFYDLQGRRVLNPQHGIFVKRQGDVTSKVIL